MYSDSNVKAFHFATHYCLFQYILKKHLITGILVLLTLILNITMVQHNLINLPIRIHLGDTNVKR